MAAIRDRLGLDYLRKSAAEAEEWEPAPSRSAATAPAASEYLEEALMTVAPRALKVLAESPDRRSSVFHLVDRLQERATTLDQVLSHLRDRGYVNYVREDLKGDHQIEITDRGMRVAG